jgi:hypothetical protein
MKFLLLFALSAVSSNAFACKRSALAGSESFLTAVLKEASNQLKLDTASITKIEKNAKGNYEVTIKGERCLVQTYEATGNADCSFKIVQLDQVDCPAKKPKVKKKT